MEKVARVMLKRAVELGIADIHILPSETGYGIYFRTVTGLKKTIGLPLEQGERLISYFKFLSNMDVGERRLPQSGACVYELEEGRLELRTSGITNFRYQESMVIRILYSTAERQMQVFFPRDKQQLEKLLQRKSGLVLFSGPVGSGKTTTIYSLLREKYDQEPLQIITMEDPVEIKEPLFLQAEVNERAGVSYEALIRQSLRHHPDVLVIGEIRDSTTARMVIRSALTGHLVLATIHARDTLGVIERMRELEVSDEQLNQCLNGIVYQRMLGKYCALCDGPCSLSCPHYAKEEKKAILFDILQGKKLKNAMLRQEGGEQTGSLNRKLRKAYACGYITEKAFHENAAD